MTGPVRPPQGIVLKRSFGWEMGEDHQHGGSGKIVSLHDTREQAVAAGLELFEVVREPLEDGADRFHKRAPRDMETYYED